jgi:hypothetical protein
MAARFSKMVIHISTKRNIALDLIARGLVTQTEAAKLIGESKQAMGYLARHIDAKAARTNYLTDLWHDETARIKPRTLKRSEGRPLNETKN